ncbi:MAG TPA: radical SAM protein [Clostridia bacterium]|nr:radical SAM protein [Clostridia bacterium]
MPLKTVIDKTQSVCPVCLRVVEAQIFTLNNKVYMEKNCAAHGRFTVYLWPDAEHYRWMASFQIPTVPSLSPIPVVQGCPEDCGICRAHRRHPTLVEIEVTERCNLRCPVCFMAAEDARPARAPDPSLEQIAAKYQFILAHNSPDTSIQLTGGEPTVRADLPEIVRIGRETGFKYIEVNTNGAVIGRHPDFIQRLAEAGISGIYLQFDGLTGEVYERIRGQDLLDLKLQAIENCRRAGVQVVLAMTVIQGINEDQLGRLLDFALSNRDVIAGLAYQPAFGSGRFEVPMEQRLTMGDVIFLLAEQSGGLLDVYDFWPLGCSHPLCSSSTYLVQDGQSFTPFTRRLSPEEYVQAFRPDSPQGSVFADIAADRYPELEPGLSILIENYMDAMNMDLKKLRECSMIVAGRNGGLVPFCGYQLTNIYGEKPSRGR